MIFTSFDSFGMNTAGFVMDVVKVIIRYAAVITQIVIYVRYVQLVAYLSGMKCLYSLL